MQPTARVERVGAMHHLPPVIAQNSFNTYTRAVLCIFRYLFNLTNKSTKGKSPFCRWGN